ncbi:N-myristoyl transferase [Sporormia fimetaria CBS 119925]|uniref:Glycylpeptide N-tetradecanoyltransferase n=1 Tax=Sporormia fimetaria CBS 119925 TaxID=1340428 RepID=A0A6A6VAH0_9PLEO|nr:N-myristoyl transferase [Sporormia fimetaria CBS 119925]
MPQEASKISEPDATAAEASEVAAESGQSATQQPADDSKASKAAGVTKNEVQNSASQGKSKKGKDKAKGPVGGDLDQAVGQHLSKDQKNMLLESNPALAQEVKAMAKNPEHMAQLLEKLNVSEMLTGLAPGGKNAKDMGAHKFWKTQPVPSYEDMVSGKKIEDGPIKDIDINQVAKEPSPLGIEGYDWCTVDLDDEAQLEEVYKLLYNHYVEDAEAMFRFRYSPSFLQWALKSPGWKKDWHVGVRYGGKQLVAFISAIPIQLRVRERVLNCSEVNFLCVHRKLRSHQLAPRLIKEVTRRCYVEGVFQAVYTVGSLLPAPVSTCRYFHRSLNWEKLYEVGFSPLPHGSTIKRQVLRYKLPSETSTPGLRPLEAKDVDAALDLLKRYLKRMDMAQEFSKSEFEHWMCQGKNQKEQVVWAYVVEDPKSKKITDFVSFYNLESKVLKHAKHDVIKAAYLFYYATESAFENDTKVLKARLNTLIKDALIMAKKKNFDVFNALTLLDNPLFLEDQRFGAGDGSLYYYLYNYRAARIPGGIDAQNQSSDKHMGGVGLVML